MTDESSLTDALDWLLISFLFCSGFLSCFSPSSEPPPPPCPLHGGGTPSPRQTGQALSCAFKVNFFVAPGLLTLSNGFVVVISRPRACCYLEQTSCDLRLTKSIRENYPYDVNLLIK